MFPALARRFLLNTVPPGKSFIVFLDLDIFEETGQLFLRLFLSLSSPGTSSRFDLDYVFWQESRRRTLFSLLSASYQEVLKLGSSVCDVNFDQVVKEISARFLP